MIANSFLLIWNAAEPEDYREWLLLWRSWSNREVFAHPDYVKLYVDGKKSYPLCAVWRSHDFCILFIYFHAVSDKKIISSELVLISADRVYSFLGGTDRNSFELRPNDLLKYEILLWAKRQGKSNFVLGGGYQPDDGIYNYKLAFAPKGSVPFFIGRRVLANDIYDRLVKNKIEQLPPPKQELLQNSQYFPKYRA